MYSMCALHCILCTLQIASFHLSATATIVNDTAIATISGLRCEGTYSIKAGGTINNTLQGPRLHKETVTVGDCPIVATTMIQAGNNIMQLCALSLPFV